MPVNALAPPSRNALQELLTQAAVSPQYGALVDYLTARRMLPPISLGGTGSASGAFESNTFFSNNLPKTGVVKVGYGVGPSTLVHELTHAADRQINSQYYELKNKRGDLTPAEQQFMQAYERLSHKSPSFSDRSVVDQRKNMAEKLAPTWAAKNSDYRATNVELPAWGMGSTVYPNYDSPAPRHLDPTMATEFSILMDLARRAQPVIPGR